MNDLELYFRYRCEKGLVERGLQEKKEYKDQLEYEIKVITDMHFCGYFLIVSDIITWALSNDIICGPGRGSAAGSLVSYVLKITHLDPIKYNLVFERFINPERKSMPDIDMDFEEGRRHEVIQYVINKYGEGCVSGIGTYGTLKSKAAIRDVARTLGLPYELGDKLARLTLDPIAGKPQSLSICYEKVKELHDYRFGLDSNEKKVLQIAEKIENRIRSIGQHASGIVISSNSVSKLVPLFKGNTNLPVTQFEMNTVDKVGLIKFDFLGLKALSTINFCIQLISKKHNINIDPLQISVDDKDTYKLFQKGDGLGIFQLESSQGIKDLVVKIKPDKLNDISLLLAVYRPGPLALPALQDYLKVRAGLAEPNYLISELKPILQETDGLLIYQEQVMEICKQLAGYSLGEADLMRRAIGKKKKEDMDKQRDRFISGCISNNINKDKAVELFSQIEEFANYSFNLAHSICYAFISYQMAYLKAHYPVELLCSCLTSDANEVDKVILYINDCKEHGIDILPPSVNHSDFGFSIDGNAIRFGLGAIKNIGEPIKDVIEERNRNGAFKDILDLMNRIDTSKINKKKLESLILCGALDNFGYNRLSLLIALDSIISYKEELKRYESKLETYTERTQRYNQRQLEIEQWNLLSKEDRKGKKKPSQIKKPEILDKPVLPEISHVKDMSIQDRLQKEKELLGFFITGHPLEKIKLKEKYTIASLKEAVENNFINKKARIKLIAIPSIIDQITTKKKQKMAYIVLEDKTGTIQATILPKKYSEYKDLIDIFTPCVYEAFVEIEIDKSVKLIINSIKVININNNNEILNLRIKTDDSKSIRLLHILKDGEPINKINLFLENRNNDLFNMGQIDVSANNTTIKRLFMENVCI